MTTHITGKSPSPALLTNPPMRYPVLYLCLIVVSTLDVVLTAVVLHYGREEFDTSREINPIARMVIEDWGMSGALLFKYALMVGVIIICEIVGRVRPRTGRVLAWVAVIISATPVMWSLMLLSLAKRGLLDV